MKLYAWQPQGHGELSWFVCAESEADARAAVDREIARRMDLPAHDLDRLHPDSMEISGWGTDYYVLRVLEPLQVIYNCNE